MRKINSFKIRTGILLLSAIVMFAFSPVVFAQSKPSGPIIPPNLPTRSGYTPQSSGTSSVPYSFLRDRASTSASLPPFSTSTAPTTADDVSAQVVNLSSNNCFDFYHFGSVQVNVQVRTPTVVTGTDLQVLGNITNKNTYPVVDGAVYIKIYKVGDYFTTLNAGYLVDQFYATTSVTVAADGSVPLSFKWHIPSYTTNGTYRIATYFVKGDSNLSGLSFTDDIQGIFDDFTVTSGVNSVVEFDKTKATLDDKPYHFVGAAPNVPKSMPIHIVAPISNSTKAGSIVGVDWKVYSWDGLSDSRLIATSSSALLVPPGGASTDIYVLDIDHPVYYAVATITYQDSKSIEAFRFVRQDIDQIRLEDPSVVTFPIQANVPTAIFTCLHGMGRADHISGGKLVLSLTDKGGSTISTYTYEGLVTGNLMLRKSLFTPKKSYDYVVLSAKLYMNNILQDEYSITYDCKVIDPSKCLSPFANVGSLLFKIAIGLVLLGLLIFSACAWKRRH